MPWPVVFQKLKMKIESSGKKRKTISHIVAGAISIGTGKPGSRRYLRLSSSSARTTGAPPIRPRGAACR